MSLGDEKGDIGRELNVSVEHCVLTLNLPWILWQVRCQQ